ncbi:hypothetical protein G9A89_009495 [Geosiphon pyriformis]|nr:hypothetical protein G9A89_009495 [Geosiphon pyriformis]
MVDIEINLDKTEIIVVRSSKKKSVAVEPLIFGSNKQPLKLLDPSTCTRYLGVWIRANGKNETVLKMIGSDIKAPGANLKGNIMQIMRERGISLKSSGNTDGISESSRPQAYLIETTIASCAIYTKVRGLLRKKNILYLHQVQNRDGSLMTWMDFTRRYRQSDNDRISNWFKILESTIIMDEHRNIDLRLRKKIEISTDGSLVKAGSKDTKGTAAFVTHGIDANFGITVDRTLSSTKTETKAVLLALEAVSYKCKLTLNTDSQAVVSTAQKWLSKDSSLSVRNQLKTSNWCTWNAIKAVISEKRIDLTINKVAAHTDITENEMANKLAKEATALATIGWAYSNKDISYISLCEGVELDLKKKTISLLNFMTTNRAKSKKVANVTFPIVTNKVSTQEGLSVIKAARQNVLATFPLKNNSNKLPLAASGSFSLPLAGSSSPVKVSSKRHTQVSPSVVFTTSKSPKIFNNRPVNKLVFPALTTPTTTTTTIFALQMTAKAKNSKKQQQAVTIAMVALNPFVVSDEIFSKISRAAASPLSDMDGNSSDTSPKMGQDQPLAILSDVVISSRSSPIPVAKQFINSDDLKDWADQMEMESTVPPPVSGAANGSVWENVNGYQRFSGWVASNLVPRATFKIKMALLGSLFQLLPGCIRLKSVSQDAVKLFCVEFASQECLNGATKVAISDEVFLTTLKIAWSSVALRDIPLGTSSDDIKTALGIFGVVTSVKLKPAGLWQYAVVNFKDISSAAAALSNWSVLVKKDSVRILLVANQKEVISSRDAFKAKLVNLPFGCTAFEISDLVSQVDLNHFAVDCKKLPLLPLVAPKISFVGSKSYAKAAVFVVPPGAAAADMELDLGGSPETTTPVLPAVSSVPNTAVESRLNSLEFHLSELFVLIKSLVEPVGALVALVTKLLSTPSAMNVSVKECVDGLAKQNKGLAAVATVI